MAKLVVANWKANLTEFSIFNFQFSMKTTVAIAAPFPFINRLQEGMIRAAQDVSRFKNGAYTGEVTAEMLKSLKVQYCLIGHSERRKYFNETKEIIEEKIKRLLEEEIIPIVCAQNETEIPKQVRDDMVIMYEPAEAISTENNFHPEDPEKVAKVVDNWKNKFKTKVLYGGSVNAENVKNYLAADGFVVGRASLNLEEFEEILKALEGRE